MTAGPFDGFIKKRPDFVGYFSTTVERSVQQKNKSQFTSWLNIITTFYNNLIKAFRQLVVQFRNDVRIKLTAIAEVFQRIHPRRFEIQRQTSPYRVIDTTNEATDFNQ